MGRNRKYPKNITLEQFNIKLPKKVITKLKSNLAKAGIDLNDFMLKLFIYNGYIDNNSLLYYYNNINTDIIYGRFNDIKELQGILDYLRQDHKHDVKEDEEIKNPNTDTSPVSENPIDDELDDEDEPF